MRVPVLALTALLALAAAAAVAGPATPDPARESVFTPGYFADVHAPTVLVYRYELTSELMPEPYVSRVRVEVRRERPDGTKEVWLDMFDGPNHRRFGPVPAVDQNPVILALLQKDVASMRNLSGGAQGYFQQQIRLAFGRPPAEREELAVQLDGRDVPAERVRIVPFRDDPAIVRFSKFRDKRYDFVVSREVPGGLYRMVIEVPDPNDPSKSVLRETLTFLRALSGASASGS